MKLKDMRKIGVTLETASKELTPIEFAAWILLHTTKQENMVGRKRMAKIIKRCESRSNCILRTLQLKDYVYVKPGPGRCYKTSFALKRVAIIKGFNQFINMSPTATVDELNALSKLSNSESTES